MEGDKKSCCPTDNFKTLSSQQKVQIIYGVLVVLLTIFSGAAGIGFWLLLLLGIGMVVDALTGKCPMTNCLRKWCGGNSCGDKTVCDVKPDVSDDV